MKRKSNEMSEFWSILDIDGEIIDTYVWENKDEYLYVKINDENLLLWKNYDKDWKSHCIMVVNHPSWFQDLLPDKTTIYTNLSKSI